jgi:hypothetical protein
MKTVASLDHYPPTSRPQSSSKSLARKFSERFNPTMEEGEPPKATPLKKLLVAVPFLAFAAALALLMPAQEATHQVQFLTTTNTPIIATYIMGTNHTSIHRNGTQMANQRLGKFMVWVCTKSRQGIFKHLLVHTHHLPYRGLVVYVWCKDGTKPPLLVVSLVSPSGHTIPCLNMPDFQR